MKIKKLPISERPYEKLEMYGANSLSNAELLAIIIKSGTKEESSVALAQKILSLQKEKDCKENNLRFLQELTIKDFMSIKGIGRVKAIQLKAVCELTKRISKPISKQDVVIRCPEDVANLLMNEMKLEKREIVKVIILNSKNVILKILNISLGGTSSAIVSPKDVLLEAIKIGAPKIILVHNHPNGDSTPSINDLKVTDRMKMSAEILGLELLDHIVIGDDNFNSIFSYKLKKGQD